MKPKLNNPNLIHLLQLFLTPPHQHYQQQPPPWSTAGLLPARRNHGNSLLLPFLFLSRGRLCQPITSQSSLSNPTPSLPGRLPTPPSPVRHRRCYWRCRFRRSQDDADRYPASIPLSHALPFTLGPLLHLLSQQRQPPPNTLSSPI